MFSFIGVTSKTSHIYILAYLLPLKTHVRRTWVIFVKEYRLWLTDGRLY
jgi:hypothetical protein